MTYDSKSTISLPTARIISEDPEKVKNLRNNFVENFQTQACSARSVPKRNTS